MSLSCGCEKGVHLCPTAEKLWRAYSAAKDIEQTLFLATCKEDDDPILHDRHRLACDVTRTMRRRYEKHVDGEDEPPAARATSGVPRQLEATVLDFRNVP